jgi:hypothetical protein
MTTAENEADIEIPVLPQTEGERTAAREIRKLWSLYQEKERQLRLTKIELEGLQFMLGERLSGMKSLLGMCGREEQWPRFLDRSRIPCTIAENCILEHEAGSVGLPAAATRPMIDEP